MCPCLDEYAAVWLVQLDLPPEYVHQPFVRHLHYLDELREHRVSVHCTATERLTFLRIHMAGLTKLGIFTKKQRLLKKFQDLNTPPRILYAPK
jgi:hypothetical protein